MAHTAVARETLFALRETIARLEGKPVPALAAAAHDVLAGESVVARPADREPARMLATGVRISMPCCRAAFRLMH